MPSKPHLILAPQAKHSEEERPQGRLSRLPYRPTLLVRERASSLLTRWHNHFFSLNHQSHPPDHPIHASIDIQKTHNRQALPWAPPQSLPAEFNRHPLLHCISRIVVPTHCIIATVSPITHEAPPGRIVAPAPALTTPANVSTFQGPSSAVSYSTILLQKPSGRGLTK